jgi:hypothetical protein
MIEDAGVPELRRNVIVQTGSIDLRYRRYPRSWGKRNSTTGCLLLPILLLLLSPPPLSLPSSLLYIIFLLLEYCQKSDLVEQKLDPRAIQISQTSNTKKSKLIRSVDPSRAACLANLFAATGGRTFVTQQLIRSLLISTTIAPNIIYLPDVNDGDSNAGAESSSSSSLPLFRRDMFMTQVERKA